MYLQAYLDTYIALQMLQSFYSHLVNISTGNSKPVATVNIISFARMIKLFYHAFSTTDVQMMSTH